MKDQIETKLNELSLLSMMLDDKDVGGLDAAASYLEDIRGLAASSADCERIATAIAQVLPLRTANPAAFIEALGPLLAAAQSVAAGNEKVAFPGETSSNPSASEFAAHYDPEFLAEFAEKHLMMLDEFEGAIADFQFKKAGLGAEEIAEFNAFVKSYLHNIKGDAGTIGLAGIERATHRLEDQLSEIPAANILETLIVYKEWVLDCISAITSGEPLIETHDKFITRVVDKAPEQSSSQSSSASTPKVVAVVETPAAPIEHDVPAAYAVAADMELFSEFRAEAQDHLDSVESLLLGCDGELSTDDIGTVFRAVHSLKGASSYFNLLEINRTSHLLENLLDEVRDGKRQFSQRLMALVLTYVDLQKKLMESAQRGVESGAEISTLPDSIRYLEALQHYANGSTGSAAAKPQVLTEIPKVDAPKAEVAPLSAASISAPAQTPAASSDSDLPAKAAKGGDKKDLKTFVKVETDRLDRLVDSIGEMVIYASMLVRSCRELLGDNESVIQTTHQVEKFSRDLQDIGMSMRLVPIKSLFQKMSRLVWDTSKKLGKDIAFTTEGEDTELDRTVIENLADPLMHMVRNAMDHGVETPEEREAKGKPRQGKIGLSASHAGGNIQIRITDDGRGLDPEKLRNKAIEKGIIAPTDRLSEEECFKLIFAAGFSTAAQVTDISGRGVGMDVVRTNIENMRGHIQIESKVNQGSVFTIELPLTLAIMDGVETVVAEERFIIPTHSILELIRPTTDMISRTAGRAETFYFRGRYMPLIRLSDLYQIQPRFQRPEDAIIAIVESGGEQIALMADDIVSSCQTVIKSLGSLFQGRRGLAGCSIMPDGKIALILDVRSIMLLARADYRLAPRTAAQPLDEQVAG